MNFVMQRLDVSVKKFALQAIWESTVLPFVHADFMETNVENIAIALKYSAMQHLAALRVMVISILILLHFPPSYLPL